ncbi:MAG: hypothetical protein JTT16_00970 [Candidatus Brockarchaeota archaeon]|nr:hypothetical protein [Candidatus Brockarchaeota archaeon]MBO3763420.1 hypothetical protein [Candidatus Brockarchaeota archaeon]MBO3767880.1 hypothetical protein [Candidatus Brockarchaeota archaeon]MBO3801243.1 hypothetical protein [Candidatus Brockarchaeota archaeon]
MSVMPKPFILYVSKRFLDRSSKTFGLGLIVRKPLVEMLKRMNVSFKELDRDEAKAALDRIAETSSITITTRQLIKNLAFAFFLPTSIFIATLKKVFYRSGVETEDSIILEFLVEIPRMFKPTLFYDMWLIVPKTEVGETNTKQLIKTSRKNWNHATNRRGVGKSPTNYRKT